VVLTETDTANGTQSTVTHTVTVTSGSTGGTPVANFTDTVSGLAATFTNTSTDTGGSATYSWNFGDGTAASTATSPSHTYAAAGSYNVVLTETDTVNGSQSTKSATVTVSGGGGGSVQLLGNTGFETTGSWTESSGVACTNSTCSGEVAHAGTGFAWLDGYGSTHTDTVSQTVTVPSGHTAGTLQYYLHIDTAETTTSTAYDTLTVALYSGSTLVRTVATYSNLNKNTGYTVHTNALTSSDLSHSSLTLKFTGKEDSSLQTSFVLDDVTLTAN
jgi:PKD repeat protein